MSGKVRFYRKEGDESQVSIVTEAESCAWNELFGGMSVEEICCAINGFYPDCVCKFSYRVRGKNLIAQDFDQECTCQPANLPQDKVRAWNVLFHGMDREAIRQIANDTWIDVHYEILRTNKDGESVRKFLTHVAY